MATHQQVMDVLSKEYPTQESKTAAIMNLFLGMTEDEAAEQMRELSQQHSIEAVKQWLVDSKNKEQKQHLAQQIKLVDDALARPETALVIDKVVDLLFDKFVIKYENYMRKRADKNEEYMRKRADEHEV